jgi:hypothetical protein
MELSFQRICFRFSSTALPSGLLNAADLPSSLTIEPPRAYSDAAKCQPPVLPAEYSPKPT